MRPSLIAAFVLAGVLFAPAPVYAQDADTPPSAFATPPHSDQPDVPTAPTTPDAELTSHQTGSASGGKQLVPVAPRVAPAVANQPIDNAPNK
jgi:hypothetical protein